jgi:hypothetical protein
MILESRLPPVSFQSIVSGQWYIITTKEWIKVDRKYSWDELKSMWTEIISKPKQVDTSKPLKISKKIFKVNGSKGNVYNVTYDSGKWSCTCPAYGWSRGKECKHIKGVKV